MLEGCRWGREDVNTCKQCPDSVWNGCSLLSGAGMLAGWGGAAVGLCNPKKKHEKIPLNPINRENIRSSFRFLIA